MQTHPNIASCKLATMTSFALSEGRHLMTVETLLLTPDEACAALNVGRTRLYELLASGELKSVTIGRSRRIPASSLHIYVERLIES